MTDNMVVPTPKALKVLVAEDNSINQRLLAGMLSALGHTCVVVSDGDKALRCLTSLEFDVVLMDVMMPVMDGLEALVHIRLQEQGTARHQPVIMATAHVDPLELAKFEKAGADGYLPKPISLESLRLELAKLSASR